MSGCMRVRFLRALSVALVAVGTAASVSAQSTPDDPYTPLNRPVESSDLAPVQVPADLWRGVDAPAVEEWLASPGMPPRSPALHELWRRVLLTTAAGPQAPDAGKAGDDVLLLRLEALYRSGLLGDIAE